MPEPSVEPAEQGYSTADLSYFGDLVGGRPVVGWHVWWRANEGRLRARLPRAEFLRLKFDRITHAANVLGASTVEFAWTPLGRAREFFDDLDPRFLDDSGLPNRNWFDVMGPLSAAVETGDAAAVRRAARAEVARARRRRRPGRQPLGELVQEAELLYEAGQHVADHRPELVGRALLEAIAAVESDDDLDEIPAISRARNRLAQIRSIQQ